MGGVGLCSGRSSESSRAKTASASQSPVSAWPPKSALIGSLERVAESPRRASPSPTQERPSARILDSYALAGKTNPDQFWSYALLGVYHANLIVDVASSGRLSAEDKCRLVRPLLTAAVAAESRPASGTPGKRGSSLLNQALIHWMVVLIEQNKSAASEPDQLVALLSGFLGHCRSPGEACLVIAAVQAVAAARHIRSVQVESLLAVYDKFRGLLSQYKQEGVCSFVPWIDAEKLLLATTGLTQIQACALLALIKDNP